jgi:hypothetical protein
MLMAVEVVRLKPGIEYPLDLGGKFIAQGITITGLCRQTLTQFVLSRKLPGHIGQRFDSTGQSRTISQVQMHADRQSCLFYLCDSHYKGWSVGEQGGTGDYALSESFQNPSITI